MNTNTFLSDTPEENISKVLSLIGQPARIQILLVIGAQEACVCHLETVLKLRQASISQHLMVLRKAGLVTAHRDGRNIFYRLARPEVLQVIDQAAKLLEIDPKEIQRLGLRMATNCPCPHCNPGANPDLTCRSARRLASK